MDEEDGFCKPGSSERRLRLRKNNKESIDNKAHLSNNSNNENNKDEESDTACISQSPRDDSILDFKSPKRIYSVLSKDINSIKLPDKTKKKVLHSKPKIINNEKKPKSRKSLQNKKIIRDEHQPLIESSFFKSEKEETESPQSSVDVKTAYVCPLCFKNLKDESSQAIHMKSCATKNNVTTKKLMDAVELQERQAAERKSLGLLSAPILQDKKKPVPRKIASCDDPDLQLALALSKSLYEKEEKEEWEDEVQIIAMSSDASMPDNNVECPQKTTLQSFGFSSSRNVLPTNNWPTSKIKKKGKLIEPTILQRRTAAERERILTERIAEILMGYKDFTQKSQEKIEEFNDAKEKIVLKSQLLKQLRQIENTLWDRTKLILAHDIFYVKQLASQITPLEKKESKLNEKQNIMKLMELNKNNETSLDNEQMQEIKEIQTIKTEDNDEALMISSNITNMCCKEKKFLDNLATSWRNILNDSSASDIIVFVKNSRHIWTHKLVFYTRCTNILLDVISNDTEFSTAKEKICWVNVDYDVALAFLEFVYCGVIDKYSKILDSETALSCIRALGRKYKINDLFVYLRQKRSKSNAQVKHNYNTCAKSTGNSHLKIETALNVLKLSKSFNESSNCTHDVKNIPCLQETLQEEVNNDLLENNSTKKLCVSQDETNILMKLSEETNSRSTPTKRQASTSPDMFDDTPVTKHSEKSIVHPEEHEDSNIHILLSLIKQDADIDIYSKKLSTTPDAEHLDNDTPTCSKNVGQNVMEIDPDPESSSLKFHIDNIHKDSLIDTPKGSKSKYSQDGLSETVKQKSNLSLFIEKIQKENAKFDAELNSDIEHSVQMSFIKHRNLFCIDRHDNSQSYDNSIEQSVDTEERPGRLSIIEQRMRSYAAKNPEFYSRLSNEHVEDVKQANSSHIDSPKKVMESHNNILNDTSPAKKHVNISKQVTIVPAVCSQQNETTNQLFSETIFNLETNEEDISMYSKYMRDHKDNSIAKYRTTINRNKSDSNLSNNDTSSDSIDKDSNISDTEKDENLTQSILIQKDADVIVSLDTDVESISSNVSHNVLENDESNYKDIISHSQQSSQEVKGNQGDNENENSSQLVEIEKFLKAVTTNTEEEKDIVSVARSNQDELNTIEIMSMTQKYSLNELNDYKNESVPSPIMVSSSPEYLNNNENYSSVSNMESLLQSKFSTENVTGFEVHKLQKSATFSFNFEDDIYLANVDIDKYEKQHMLEKSQSFNILSTREFKSGSARNNKSNENIRDTDKAADDYRNLGSNVTSSTQNFESIKKFKRKSLSEGQIDTNRLRNREATSTRVSMQFQCNYIQNIENAKTPKITDKDVTPPPDYNDMNTPELHKEMKKYGLKVQKRCRAVKLLTHIYNELHPLISEKTMEEQIAEISSDEEKEPPLKKRNMNDNSLEKSSNAEDSGNELPCSQDSNDSASPESKETINKEMEFYEIESLSALENSLDIKEAFMRLINIDKDLYNKILRYEPVNIEQLRSILRTHGFKCKCSNLMSFLDQQCITFYVPEQSFKNRTCRKS